MFENIRIYEQKGHVAFFKNSTKIYWFRNEELSKIKNEDNINLSECVDRLNYRSWVKPELQYQLARIICKKNPTNSINWQQQFYTIEYINLLNQAFYKDKPKNKDEIKSQQQVKKEVLDLITFARDFKPVCDIEKLVSEKLKVYKIGN